MLEKSQRRGTYAALWAPLPVHGRIKYWHIGRSRNAKAILAITGEKKQGHKKFFLLKWAWFFSFSRKNNRIHSYWLCNRQKWPASSQRKRTWPAVKWKLQPGIIKARNHKNTNEKDWKEFQTINQSINRRIDQSINQSIEGAINQSINRSTMQLEVTENNDFDLCFPAILTYIFVCTGVFILKAFIHIFFSIF